MECDPPAPAPLRRRDWLLRQVQLVVGASGCAWSCSRSESPSNRSASASDRESKLMIRATTPLLERGIIDPFAREHDCEVIVSPPEDPLDLENELLADRGSIDVIVATSALIARWLAVQAFEPIDLSALRGFDRIDPRFLPLLPKQPPNAVVPISIRYDGIGYRSDKLEVPPDGSAIFLDGRYRTKMVMRDDARSVLGALLRLRGASRNASDAKLLELARQDAVAAKKNLRGLESVSAIPLLIDGDAWVAQLGRGEVMRARRTQPTLEWVLPKEGGALEIDVVAVPRTAPHPKLAQAFVEHLLKPDVSAAIVRTSLDGTPNREARQLLLAEGSEASYEPDAAAHALLEVATDLGRDQVIWDRTWNEVVAPAK